MSEEKAVLVVLFNKLLKNLSGDKPVHGCTDTMTDTDRVPAARATLICTVDGLGLIW